MGEIDNIFGATLCGVVAAAWLFGILCVFTYQYYKNYQKDPLHTKILVGLLMSIQLMNQVFITAMIYYYLVTEYAEPGALTRSNWEWSAFIGLESFTATLVQLYYAQRVRKLTNSRWLTAVVVLLSLCQLAFGLGTMIVTAVVRVFNDFLPWTWICISWLGCSAACDLLVTASQIWFLRQNGTDIKDTTRMIKMLTLYILSTGALTSISTLVELTTFAALGWNFTHVFVSQFTGGLYVLSLLANLNVRRTLRGKRMNLSVKSEVRLESIRFTRAITHARSSPGDGNSTAAAETDATSSDFSTTKLPSTHSHFLEDKRSLSNTLP